MSKKIIPIILALSFLAPFLSSAQISAPVLPNIPNINQPMLENISLPAPISNFIEKLKNINIKGSAMPGGGSSLDFSSVKSTWDSINNWFSANIGVSFSDIIRAVANLIIWIWELIIKLIQAGLSYL